MNAINNIPSKGTFGAAVEQMNQNFSLIVTAINELDYKTTRSKGILNNGTTPASAITNAVKGDWCMVLGTGNTFPATIYTYNGTKWTSGGTWSPSNTIDLQGYYTKTQVNEYVAEEIGKITIETVDNLNEEASGKALDAHQGFVLAGQIDAVREGNIDIARQIQEESPSDLNSYTGQGRYGYVIDGTQVTEGWYDNVAVEAASSYSNPSRYFIGYERKFLSKGTVVHYARTTSGTAYRVGFGFTTVNPDVFYNKHGTFEGMVIERVCVKVAQVHDWTFVMPFDGYFVYSSYSYNNNWAGPSSVTLYLTNYLKTKVAELETHQAEIERNSMDALVEDCTDMVYWTKAGSTTTNAGTTITPSDGKAGGGVVTIDVASTKSGWRFGMYLGGLPLGKYTIEFDLASGTLEGGTGYADSNTTQSGNVITKEYGAHCILHVEKNNATLNYYLFATQTVGVDTYTIENFSVVRTTKDISGRLSQLEESSQDTANILKGMLQSGVVVAKHETLVPAVSETYQAMLRTSVSKNFAKSGDYLKRLTYYPEFYVVGGEELTLRYTGLNAVRIQQLPWRDLGTSPINTFTDSELLAYTSCPSSQEDGFTGEVTITLDKRCRRVAFVWGNTQDVMITPSQVLESITEVVLPVPDTTQIDFSKLSFDASELKISDYVERIAQAKFSAKSPSPNSLGLLHFSDLHGDDTAVNTIKQIAAEAGGYIDDIVCTGDSTLYFAEDNAKGNGYDNEGKGNGWWKNTGLAERCLFVLGNHDAATPNGTRFDTQENSAAWNGEGQVWSYETYFRDYAERWGVTRPTGNDGTDHPACYWHKDYTSQKVRLIGLDCMNRFDGTVDPTTGAILTSGFKHMTNEQELWLIERLNETLNPESSVYGYGVVFMCHYPLDWYNGDNEEWDDTSHRFIFNQKADGGRVMNFKTGAPVNFHFEGMNTYTHTNKDSNWHKFNMNNRVADEQDSLGYIPGKYNNVGKIIEDWMSHGGKYIVWLCGHTHYDIMCYPHDFPNMLCVVIDQAGCLRGTNVGSRPDNLTSRTCANYVSIDQQNGLIKIVRIGFSMNKFMNSHQYMCYDYINRKVLNEG